MWEEKNPISDHRENAKVRENLLKEKKLTLEKAVHIARAAESTAAQMKVMSSESSICSERTRKRSV